MKRINAWLGRLGTAGVLGLGALLACAGFYLSAVVPAERELAAQQLAAERLRTRSPQQPVAADGRGDQLRRFYNLFPPVNQLTDQLEQLYGIARKSQLELSQGEYRLEKRGAGLWSYRAAGAWHLSAGAQLRCHGAEDHAHRFRGRFAIRAQESGRRANRCPGPAYNSFPAQ